MGYTKSPRAIRRVQEHLDLMLEAQSDLEFEAEDASQLLYRIREAINYSRIKSNDPFCTDDNLKKYAVLNSKYILRLKKNHVYCELRAGSSIPVQVAMKQMRFENLSDSLEVIGALIEHRPDSAVFPDYPFDDAEVEDVLEYAKNNNYIVERPFGKGIRVKKNAE